jgi:hypothetical protein
MIWTAVGTANLAAPEDEQYHSDFPLSNPKGWQKVVAGGRQAFEATSGIRRNKRTHPARPILHP